MILRKTKSVNHDSFGSPNPLNYLFAKPALAFFDMQSPSHLLAQFAIRNKPVFFDHVVDDLAEANIAKPQGFEHMRSRCFASGDSAADADNASRVLCVNIWDDQRSLLFPA